MQQRIERVNEIPLLLHWLDQMGVQEKAASPLPLETAWKL